MVPGALAYRTMLGIIHLTGDVDQTTFVQLLHETSSNGIKAFFVLMVLSLGVSAPMLLTRRESVITSYSIHYTKLYDSMMSINSLRSFSNIPIIVFFFELFSLIAKDNY